MHTATVVSSVTVLGKSYSTINDNIEADNAVGPDTTIPPAKTGTLTVRTDNTTGSLTLAAGHGVVTGDKINIYWNGGSRYDVTVGTVAVNVVPISAGSGDNLPVAATAITAKVPDVENCVAIGDNVVFFACQSDTVGHVVFLDAANAVLLAVELGAGESFYWSSTGTSPNPLAGVTVGKVALGHADATDSAKMRAVLLYN
jgi:hypothetical protein